MDVVCEECGVNGPLGFRKYDVVVRGADGTLKGVEVKTSVGDAKFNSYQDFTDTWVNRLGAPGVGKLQGQTVTGASKVLLPAGGM